MANLASTYQSRALGRDHPDTLESIANLASMYRNQGRFKEAERLGVEVVEARKQVLGKDHPYTLESIANLASTYWSQGRFEEAERLQVEVVEARKQVLGKDHLKMLTSIPDNEDMDETTGMGSELTHTVDRPLDQKVINLITRLQALLGNKEEYRQLLACRAFEAQRLLDMFQRLLDTLEAPSSFHRKLIVATQKLAGKSGLYPACYELANVMTAEDRAEATGGFSDIYKGIFAGRAVCLKTIRVDKQTEVEHLLKVCSREAILWGQLSHPNLLPFFGLFRYKHRVSLVAPWMEHGNVNEFLKKHPGADRILLIFDVAKGLEFLHKNEIIHGDLKGANILIKESGRACITDFGISSISDREILAWTTHSTAASKGGTVRWQAPELFDPEGEEDIPNTVESDIYSWSCVVYEIFTELLPFHHIPRDTTIMHRARGGERPRRPRDSSASWSAWGLTEYIWTLMQDCWKTNPQERPTVDKIIKHLERMVPEDTRPIDGDNMLSSAEVREITRRGVKHDEMSVETLESLLRAS